MRKDIKEQQHLDELRSLLFQKGYRRPFMISVPGRALSRFKGTLDSCLNFYLDYAETNQLKAGRLEMETMAPYNDKIAASFKINFDPQEGFQIRQMVISKHGVSNHLNYDIRHNREIPGSMTLEGLFPKQKPWERHLKGFRR